MTDFVDNLIDRHFSAAPPVVPRLPSLFETETRSPAFSDWQDDRGIESVEQHAMTTQDYTIEGYEEIASEPRLPTTHRQPILTGQAGTEMPKPVAHGGQDSGETHERGRLVRVENVDDAAIPQPSVGNSKQINPSAPDLRIPNRIAVVDNRPDPRRKQPATQEAPASLPLVSTGKGRSALDRIAVLTANTAGVRRVDGPHRLNQHSTESGNAKPLGNETNPAPTPRLPDLANTAQESRERTEPTPAARNGVQRIVGELRAALVVPVVPSIPLPQETIPEPVPVINVSIGRIEVRAAAVPEKSTRKSEHRLPVMGLQEYLRNRSGSKSE